MIPSPQPAQSDPDFARLYRLTLLDKLADLHKAFATLEAMAAHHRQRMAAIIAQLSDAEASHERNPRSVP